MDVMTQTVSSDFDYDSAFSRNIGWVTRQEQGRLRKARIAIAGLGGVGGSHLLALTRLGIGAFNIADFDAFEIHNTNRQAGASVSYYGQNKARVLSALAKDVNPTLDLITFEAAVTPENVDAFLRDVDVYVDGLDFFAFDARKMLFEACARKGIPAVTVAPIAMGAALLNFIPGKMTFEEYFRFGECGDEEKALRFIVGLSPSLRHRKYLVDPTAVDFEGRKGPSTSVACSLCAGIATTEVLKLVLGRGKVMAAPHGIYYDAFGNTSIKTWTPFGNLNPIQLIKIMFAKIILKVMKVRKSHE